ncbi:uncharacterized protein LOC123262811 [Cotesia glomerata]|uniref:uncharacterized protein LOC123262811 n=1 Tax=Cotesia glomerata TaxID=32391 RepID=UPI001D019DFC|nr:uncharacterized protein LOC123262811 [Cotesia glomerata]
MFRHIVSCLILQNWFSKLTISRLIMRLFEIILCWCCVLTGQFSNGSSIHSSEIKSRLINHTMELIDKSFANNSNPLIISSDFVDDQVVSGNIDNGNPVIVINSDLSERRIEIKGYLSSYPTYNLRFESLYKLIALILGFMASPTWNIKSPIFVLDISEEPHVDAFNVISFLGYFDTLISYYMCYDNDKHSTIVYTLNPYTQYAPLPWNQVKFSNANINNKTKSTLYSLQYPKDLKNNYKNIYFDKTQYLDGHKTKLFARVISTNSIEQNKKENINRILKHFVKIKDYGLNSLPDYMKVKASVHILKSYFNSDIIKHGFDRDLNNHQYDAINVKNQLADTNPKLTDYLTTVTEIHINFQFIFITLLVLLIAVIIIMNSKFDVSEGIMDIVSMSLSMGITSPMGRLLMRIIYFFGFCSFSYSDARIPRTNLDHSIPTCKA